MPGAGRLNATGEKQDQEDQDDESPATIVVGTTPAHSEAATKEHHKEHHQQDQTDDSECGQGTLSLKFHPPNLPMEKHFASNCNFVVDNQSVC